MAKRFLFVLIFLPSCLIYGQNDFYIDTVTIAAIFGNGQSAIGGVKYIYNEHCQLIQELSAGKTISRTYQGNTITIETKDSNNNITSIQIEEYSDFDSLLVRTTNPAFSSPIIDSFFYNDQNLLITRTNYQFDNAIKHLIEEQIIDYENGLVRNDSTNIFFGNSCPTYKVNKFLYDPAGNQILKDQYHNEFLCKDRRDSTVSIYDANRISSKRQFQWDLDDGKGIELFTTYMYEGDNQYETLSARNIPDGQFHTLSERFIHLVDAPFIEYDTLRTVAILDNDFKQLLRLEINTIEYDSTGDSLKISEFFQNITTLGELLVTGSVKSNYVKKCGLIDHVENEFEDHFFIFPNPSLRGASVIIKSNKEFNTIRVFNSLGELVLTKTSGNKRECILNHDFVPGIYYIAIFKDERHVSDLKKLIISQ